MKSTMTTAAANTVTHMSGRGWMRFNDRLKDGRRSLKVLGWKPEDYRLAQELLERAGCEVDLVEFASESRYYGWHTVHRLHVTEPTR